MCDRLLKTTGRLEIGYVASAAYSGVLQEQFARFRASHPGIHIGAREQAMDALPGLPDQGREDLAFVRPPLHLPDGIASVVLLRDRFVLAVQAVQADSPMARLDVAGPVALAQQAFIVPHSVMASVQLPGVVFRELEEPQISSEIAVAFRRHEQAPAARAFIAQLRAVALA